MTGRRAKPWLQACLFLAATSLIVYAFYINRTLSSRVAIAERKSAQHAKQEEQLGNQLQAVTEYRSRLERQTRQDRELINQLKKESTLRESDLETQLQEHKEESSRKYSLLSKAHSSLQEQHEGLKEKLKQVQDSQDKLSSSHAEAVRRHSNQYSQLKREKDIEVKRLSDNLNRVTADRTSAIASLRQAKESLQQLNAGHAQLKSEADILKGEHSKLKGEHLKLMDKHDKNLAGYRRLSLVANEMKSTIRKQLFELDQYKTSIKKKDTVKPTDDIKPKLTGQTRQNQVKPAEQVAGKPPAADGLHHKKSDVPQKSDESQGHGQTDRQGAAQGQVKKDTQETTMNAHHTEVTVIPHLKSKTVEDKHEIVDGEGATDKAVDRANKWGMDDDMRVKRQPDGVGVNPKDDVDRQKESHETEDGMATVEDKKEDQVPQGPEVRETDHEKVNVMGEVDNTETHATVEVAVADKEKKGEHKVYEVPENQETVIKLPQEDRGTYKERMTQEQEKSDIQWEQQVKQEEAADHALWQQQHGFKVEDNKQESQQGAPGDRHGDNVVDGEGGDSREPYKAKTVDGMAGIDTNKEGQSEEVGIPVERDLDDEKRDSDDYDMREDLDEKNEEGQVGDQKNIVIIPRGIPGDRKDNQGGEQTDIKQTDKDEAETEKHEDERDVRIMTQDKDTDNEELDEEELGDQRDKSDTQEIVNGEEELREDEDIEKRDVDSDLLHKKLDNRDWEGEEDGNGREIVETHDERSWEENPDGREHVEVGGKEVYGDEGDGKDRWEKEEEEEVDEEEEEDYGRNGGENDGNQEDDGHEVDDGVGDDGQNREDIDDGKDREVMDRTEEEGGEKEEVEDEADNIQGDNNEEEEEDEDYNYGDRRRDAQQGRNIEM